jgi:citrate lyase subunit beta/citryl-CoA lyase
VILDLEDSAPIALKGEARLQVSTAINNVAATDKAGPKIIVRVNGARTAFLADDLEAVVRPGLDAIMMPKADTVKEVQDMAACLDRLEHINGMRAGSVEIILFIENALGVYRCFDLVQSSPRIAATCFGSAQDGDLQTDLGCSWSIEGTELLFARSKVLLDTRAAASHVLALDGVFSNLSDEAALLADSRLSARLGYVGRTIIHPKQIEPVRQAYAVPTAEVAYYGEVVARFEAVEKDGTAAITVQGKLVDYAMYERAKRVIELSRLDVR